MGTTTEKYLAYLDKEMTIMGILSAFAVAVPALVVSKVTGSDPHTPLSELWKAQAPELLFGSVSFLLSALYFYRERSLLAWFFGQLALSESLGEPATRRQELLTDADSWSTWIYYRWGFIGTYLGFTLYGLAFAAVTFTISPRTETCTVIVCAAVALVAAAFYRYALTRYAYCEHPFRRALFQDPPKDCRCRGHCDELQGVVGNADFRRSEQ